MHCPLEHARHTSVTVELVLTVRFALASALAGPGEAAFLPPWSADGVVVAVPAVALHVILVAQVPLGRAGGAENILFTRFVTITSRAHVTMTVLAHRVEIAVRDIKGSKVLSPRWRYQSTTVFVVDLNRQTFFDSVFGDWEVTRDGVFEV